MFSRAFVPSYGVKHASGGGGSGAEIEFGATESRWVTQEKKGGITAVLLLPS